MLEAVVLQEAVVVVLQEAVVVVMVEAVLVVAHLGGDSTCCENSQNICPYTGQGDLGTPHTHVWNPSLSHSDSTPCTSPVDTGCQL